MKRTPAARGGLEAKFTQLHTTEYIAMNFRLLQALFYSKLCLATEIYRVTT